MKLVIETNLATLMEVLNQTSNPDHAIKLLEGTYTAPVVPSIDGVIFDHFNPWRNTVRYRSKFRYYTDEDHTKDYNYIQQGKYKYPMERDDYYSESISLERWMDYYTEKQQLKDNVGMLRPR